MQRARLIETGWSQNLRVEHLTERPRPSEGQVLLRVEACGVCHRDLIDRSGRFPFLDLPITPGHEVAGRVTEVGPGTTEWQPGDRVATLHRDSCGACAACRSEDTPLCENAVSTFGLTLDGGYATWLVAPERALYSIPEELPAEQAAVLHCTFGTAYRALTLAGVKSGSRVIVTGANGGVGVAAVQVARRLGARVFAVTRSAEHRDSLVKLGADEVIEDDGASFHKSVRAPLDAALDCVGVPTFNATLRSLRSGGTVVTVGNVTGERAALNLGYVITRGISIRGSSGASRRDMAATLALHAARPFTVPIWARFPLTKADEAQRAVRKGNLCGRVVLEMPEESD